MWPSFKLYRGLSPHCVIFFPVSVVFFKLVKIEMRNRGPPGLCSLAHRLRTTALEYIFHVNEIYLSHAIKKIEGKSKGKHASEVGTILNKFNSITNSNSNCKAISVPITPIGHGYCSDQMCSLVLS